GLILWLPEANQTEWQNVTVRVSDGQLDATQSFQVYVAAAQGNRRPVITSTPPFLAEAGVEYDYQVQAFDPDGDQLRFGLKPNPWGTPPDGMTINAATGLVQWTPTEAQARPDPYRITVAVFDVPGGLGTAQTFNLYVIVNHAPVIDSSPVTTVTEGQ